MPTHQFYVEYFNTDYLKSQFPNQDNIPHFQLAEGEIGGISGAGGDPYESSSPDCTVISSPVDFPGLTLGILRHLKRPESLRHPYKVHLSNDASKQIGRIGEKVLEEIVALHNDFITPRRT